MVSLRRGSADEYTIDELRRWLVNIVDMTIDLEDLVWRIPTLVSDSGVNIRDWDENTRLDLEEQILNASRGQIRDYAREAQENVRPARDRRRRRRRR